MNCKHCNYVIDDESYDVCPNCGKPLKDEPAEEVSDAIELPMKKEETAPEVKEKKEETTPEVELSEEDNFTANFIKKDDPLSNLDKIKKESEKASTAMMISRIAALLAVLFFAGVLYYTKVVLPKVQQEMKEIDQELHSGDDDPTYTNTTKANSSTGQVEMEAAFGNDLIIASLNKAGIEYNKDITDVDITIKYPEKVGDQDFNIYLKRIYNGTYSDIVSFKKGETMITGIVRTYSNYNEDLITNIINSYVVNKSDDTVFMYTKSSTFQLANPTVILMVKYSQYEMIEKVITTYSTDGVSITQCPITVNNNEISYCKIDGSFDKGKEVQIQKVKKTFGESEQTTETVVGLVAK